MLANWITLSRFPLLLVNILLLYFGSPLITTLFAVRALVEDSGPVTA